MIKVHEVEQGTDEWLELRSGKYTGSNAHKLLKFGAKEYSLTETGKFRGNYWTKRGHLLEAEAIDLYEQIKKVSVERCGFVTNDLFPDCGYSPDGLTEDRTIEVKSFDEKKHLEMFNGNIPFEVLAQCHFGMLICDKKLCDLIIYNPNLDPKRAFKIITIKSKRQIKNNFKRILIGEVRV
jgi:hypothetical protein